MTDAERSALLKAIIRDLPAILIKGGQMPESLISPMMVERMRVAADARTKKIADMAWDDVLRQRDL